MNTKKFIYITFIILFIITIYFLFKKNKKYGCIKEEGFVMIKNILNQEDCDKIMMTVNTEMLNKNKEEFFVNSGYNRKNIALPIDENIKHCIFIIINKINHIIKSDFKNPALVECGVSLSYPNSKNQEWTKKLEDDKMYTVFISLDDISKEEGVTQVQPKTHIKNNDSKTLVNLKCERGDMYILNSKVLQRDIRNNSNLIRPTFYFSIKDDNNKKLGNKILTLKSEYKGKILLKKIKS